MKERETDTYFLVQSEKCSRSIGRVDFYPIKKEQLVTNALRTCSRNGQSLNKFEGDWKSGLMLKTESIVDLLFCIYLFIVSFFCSGGVNLSHLDTVRFKLPITVFYSCLSNPWAWHVSQPGQDDACSLEFQS